MQLIQYPNEKIIDLHIRRKIARGPNCVRFDDKEASVPTVIVIKSNDQYVSVVRILDAQILGHSKRFEEFVL